MTNSQQQAVAISEAQQRVARAWFALLPQGWEKSELFYGRAGEHLFCLLEADSKGVRSPVEFTPELREALAHLRRVMTSPEGGAWLSVALKARADGGEVEAFYNWDRRYAINGSPTPFDPPQGGDAPAPSLAAFLTELQAHPRAVQFWPAWLAAPGAAVPDFRRPVAPPAPLAWMLGPSERPYWSSMLREVDTCLQGQLRISPELSPELLGHAGPAARLRRLRELATLAAQCAMRTLGRSQATVAAAMRREWALHGGQPQLDLGGLNLDQLLNNLPQGGPAEALRRDLEGALRELAAGRIADVFGVQV